MLLFDEFGTGEYTLHEYRGGYCAEAGFRGRADYAELLDWGLCEGLGTWEVRFRDTTIAEFEAHNANAVRAWLIENPVYAGERGAYAWKEG